MKMEAMILREISVDFQRTTWRYIPEDGILQNYSFLKIRICQVTRNLKSSSTSIFMLKTFVVSF
jgi:hypothetical protein